MKELSSWFWDVGNSLKEWPLLMTFCVVCANPVIVTRASIIVIILFLFIFFVFCNFARKVTGNRTKKSSANPSNWESRVKV